MDHKGFAMVLGVLSASANGVMMNQVLRDGPVLKDAVLPLRVSTPLLADDTTRDLKFILALIEVAFYTCLALGALFESPMMMVPWLVMKLALMIVAVLITTFNLVLQKPMTLSTIGLISVLTEIHNFLTVLCLYEQLVKT